MEENAIRIEEDKSIDVFVNLHPSIAFRVEDYHSPIIFASFKYLDLIGRHIRVPAGSRRMDASVDFEIPQTIRTWSLVRSVFTLAVDGDPANVIHSQIARYTALRKENHPDFECTTIFKCLASFFDDTFYPALGNLRYPLKAFITAQQQTHAKELRRFDDFYGKQLEQALLKRYLSIFDDFFDNFSQFRQMLVHARVGDDSVDDLVVGAKNFNHIKLYYGQAYETLTSSYVTLA